MELERAVYGVGSSAPKEVAPPVFYVTPHDDDEYLALHVGDAVIPIQRYSNPALVARTAAIHLAELMGDVLGDRVYIQFENVFDGLGSVTVEVPLESVRISSMARKLVGFDPRVVERVIEIAEEIREEGREGKKVGTLFVIGDPAELALYTKQLILNPFKGYLPEERNILKDELKETIKEFAQLDGAFIVGKDGTVHSAGTYIDVNVDGVRRYPGWGTKHLAAAAITAKTDSVSVLLSESGGKIKVFYRGKIIDRR